MWFLTGYKTCVKATPATIYVNNDNIDGPWYGTVDYPFRNITSGLHNASIGDTVFVFNGIYNETVTIDETISLVGENRDLTIIDGGKSASVVSILATENVTVKGFTIRNSGTSIFSGSGIYIEDSSFCVVNNNRIINNNNGIGIYYSSKNIINSNIITSNNKYGIFCYYCTGNTISNNVIDFSNEDGAGLYYSIDNVFYGNVINSNNKNGIGLYFYSQENTIYCNNFYTNPVLSELRNYWDRNNKGNYWSYYSGRDSDKDGIGDNPYIIDAINRDEHPLMGAFSDFDVTLKKTTYHITVICNSTISNFTFEIGQETGNKIISFDVAGEESSAGFCRIEIPVQLMNYTHILINGEKANATSLNVPDAAYATLYLTFTPSSHITIISSETFHLYSELLEKHAGLQADLNELNATYYDLLKDLEELLDNNSQLQEEYQNLNNSYQEHLLDYSEKVYNIRNLMYIFAATTAIFIVTTIYLSKHAHKMPERLG